MKVSLKPHEVQTALYRNLSRIPSEQGCLYELKITVTPKGQAPFNIVIGFTEDDLAQFLADAKREMTG